MGLDRDKLRRSFRRPGAAAGAPSPAPAAAANAAAAADAAAGEIRDLLQRRLRALRPPPALPAVELPAGEVLSTPAGPLWRRRLRYPLGSLHGAVPLWPRGDLDCERLQSLAKEPAFAALDPAQCLFLDTETTGLSGGAGTVVFAVGLGHLDGDEFVLEQTFLRDFGEELALLQHFVARLRERPLLVTFVGKSYDRHRLHARLLLHRLEAPVLQTPHLDLYHLIRRAYGKQWPDTRLRTAEQRLLGLHRHDDLPGSEAPAAFFAWLRDRSGPVDRVLEHNRLDVLSLCALLGCLLQPGLRE